MEDGAIFFWYDIFGKVRGKLRCGIRKTERESPGGGGKTVRKRNGRNLPHPACMEAEQMREQYIPARLEQDFVEEAVRINGLVMTAVSLFAIAVEIFNVIRVLFLSNSGLTTLNNRIYFTFYLFLFAAAVSYLAVDRLMKLGTFAKYRLVLTAGSVFLLWQTLFNMYDISRSLSMGKIMAITTLVAFSAIGVMKPWYAICNLVLNYALLIPYVFIVGGNDSGVLFNYLTTAGICFVIYFVRFHDIRTELIQKQEIVDISRQLAESRKQFSLSREQYALILQKSHFIAFEWNINGGEVRFSKEWEEVFGKDGLIPNAESFIRELRSLKQQYKTEILQCMENLRNGEPYQKRDLLLPVSGGEERWFELHLILQMDDEGAPVVGIGMLFDIMDQKQRILELEKELEMDNFTRLLNKTALESYGRRKLGELRETERLYMLILDMDHFKQINDSFGHPCGDYVLEQVAGLMRGAAPEGARVGRLGGDEFGVLLATSRRKEEFVEYAQNLVEGVRKIRWQDTDVKARCSIGIAALGAKEGSWMKLYGDTDKSLYMAKRAGKDCVHIIG